MIRVAPVIGGDPPVDDDATAASGGKNGAPRRVTRMIPKRPPRT
jgi:hypothetical protein